MSKASRITRIERLERRKRRIHKKHFTWPVIDAIVSQTKPAEMSEAEWERVRNDTAGVFDQDAIDRLVR